MIDKQIKLSSNVLMQKVADEAVLLDLDSQSYFGLDPVGTVIWEALSESKNELEIVKRITEEFDVSPDIAQLDLREFLEKLIEDKLVSSD